MNDWVSKHLANRDTTKQVVKNGERKLLQTKIDRTLAEDFKIMSAALGKTQRELIEDWMAELIFNFKRGKL
jgi:hypothetical protein|tara:strand:+ start:223 stop:435 length:213 start_codon:yes stop_codon:yes gene_type:complete